MSNEFPNNRSMSYPPGWADSFDVDAFDNAIRSQGVSFVHFRAMRCPVGIIDKDEQRRPHDHHAGCSNGFLYTEAGKLTALFNGNNHDNQQTTVGILADANVHVTFPRFYDKQTEVEDDVEVEIAPFDRLYLDEPRISVPHWQLVEYNQSGEDRLSFPAVSVTDLVDSRGIRYRQGEHFELTGKGHIKWTSSTRPGYDVDAEKGVVYSIRYRYRPYWYVQRLIHEIRVSQVEKLVDYDGNTERRIERLNMDANLQREYVFEKEDNDPQAPDPSSARQSKSPRSGQFGPR